MLSFRRGLLKSCWEINPSKRPKASDLVTFLAQNARIIKPCLTSPINSVQTDNHNENLTCDSAKPTNVLFLCQQQPHEKPLTNDNPTSHVTYYNTATIKEESSLEHSDVEIPMEECSSKEPLLKSSGMFKDVISRQINGDVTSVC